MDAPLAPTESHALERWLVECAAQACRPCNASEPESRAAWLVLDAALARAFEALRDPDCTRLLGPVVRGATMARGARVPGTSYELDPVKAAFDIGVLAEWQDRSAEVDGTAAYCASACLGAILACADYLSRNAPAAAREPLSLRDVLDALIVASDLRGGAALADDCHAAGVDPAFFVRVAATGVAARMLGCDQEGVRHALSHALLDGPGLAPHDPAVARATRLRWSNADANSRAVRLALLATAGEPGCAWSLRPGESHVSMSALLARHPYAGPRLATPRSIVLQLEAPATLRDASRLEAAVAAHYPAAQATRIKLLLADRAALAQRPVHEFVALLVRN